MVEFNDLNNKPKKEKITNKHIKATRSTKHKKSKKLKTNVQVQGKNVYIPNSLRTKLSENYEGKTGGIIEFISTLPNDVQTFINTSNVKTVKARQGYSLYVLDNKVTIKIKEENIDNKKYLRIVVSHKRKELFNNLMKW